MKLKNEESNIAIRTLHQNPAEFVRKHVFPQEVKCGKCRIEHILDMPSDLVAERDSKGTWGLYHSCLVCHSMTKFELGSTYGLSPEERHRYQALSEGYDTVLKYYRSLTPARKRFVQDYEGALFVGGLITVGLIYPSISGIFFGGWEQFFVAIMVELVFVTIIGFFIAMFAD